MKKGFSLIELLIYVSIFAVAGGMMFGILTLILKVNQRESSSGEITGQMNFISQTISRLTRNASNVEIDAGVATSTLKLRMKDASKDPTCIYLENSTIKLIEGNDDITKQNCDLIKASNLTNDRVKVDKLEFKKLTQYPGHDSVEMNIQMSYNSPNPGAQATREIKSASMRFSTAEFSDNIIPTADSVYDIGTSTLRWRNAALSGNLLVAGNVGIGTTTPSEKLTVVDGNILQNISTFPPILIGGAENTTGNDIYVSGRYAYIVTYSYGSNEFQIYDVSNPATPILVGGEDLGDNPIAGWKIYVSERYAYIVTTNNTSGNEFQIYDISNPATPSLVGGADLGTDAYGIYVSGRYAYIVTFNVPGNEFQIYDISNPATPSLVGGVDLEATGNDIYISGRYAYIVTDFSGGPNEFKIYDISNSASPSLVGEKNLGNNVYGIYISGRYAYIVRQYNSSPGTNEFQIYDISNPATPSLVGEVDLEATGNDIYISGRYAYIGSDNISGNNCPSQCEFKIYDVSNPSAPVLAGSADLESGGNSIYVSGRYAYVVQNSVSGNEFKIFDISGLEAVSANIHSLEAGNLQVRNDIIAQGQMQITGGINVGTGGIFSAGPIGISIASTTQSNALSAYFQGRVGIATTTPTQKLEVNGGIRLNPVSESQPVCTATTTGVLWHVQGANDELQICAASSSVYAWRPL